MREGGVLRGEREREGWSGERGRGATEREGERESPYDCVEVDKGEMSGGQEGGEGIRRDYRIIQSCMLVHARRRMRQESNLTYVFKMFS